MLQKVRKGLSGTLMNRVEISVQVGVGVRCLVQALFTDYRRSRNRIAARGSNPRRLDNRGLREGLGSMMVRCLVPLWRRWRIQNGLVRVVTRRAFRRRNNPTSTFLLAAPPPSSSAAGGWGCGTGGSGAWFTAELDAPEAPDATIMLAGVISISNKPPMPAKRIPPVNPTLCKKRRAPLQGLGIPF